MTVSQMRKLLRGLPGSLQIMMETGEDILMSVCAENSQVVEIPLLDEDETDEDITDETEYAELLLLVPCHHKCETEIGELNSQPELN